MLVRSISETRRGLYLSLVVLGLITAVILLPYKFGANAASDKPKGLFTRTTSADPALPNYDIRLEKNDAIVDFMATARNASGKDAVVIADIRDRFVQGENALRQRVPTLKIEYNEDIRIPEVITPDVWKAKMARLTNPSNEKRSEILRNFVKGNTDLVGVTRQQADDLIVTADYTNPDGNLSYAHLEQRPNGIPVFRSEVKAGFTQDGRILRVINNLAPGLDYGQLSMDFRDPLDAVRAAAGFINHELTSADVAYNEKDSTDLKAVFGTGDWATTAEKMYFPTEPGVAVPAWRVLIWQPVNAYYVIVDAATGTMLWRKNLTNDQTQSATYNVYRNAPSYLDVADSPAPLSPGPVNPTLGTQGAVISRSNLTLIGNEGTNSFNNNGWITDGANITDGNAVEAGIDRVAPNGVDAPQTGSPNRVFSSTWNPAPGSPAPGDDPLTAQAQRGAVIQMFYVMNRYHDEMYKRGFTEAALNYQQDNFGRGGLAGDRISAEGQDSSGTNNANFSIAADGTRGRMQMFLWTGPTPDYDGTGDAEVIIHEVTHGTSQRLHGNALGLTANMSGGMGEGWGDFYGYTMLAEPTDPINAVYTTGGYATYLITAGFTGNYYYGIRRFPRAPITFLGPNNKPHNPLTFRYANSDCNTLIGTTTSNPPPSSAYPRGPIGVTTCDQVHNLGEIWSSALWEVRNRMVTRLGFTNGTTRVLQVVTDGMKLAPLNPTFLQERDAIITAASALPIAPEASADVTDVREGFRVRGMGFSASIQNATGGATAVTEAFDAPTVGNGGEPVVTSGNALLEPNECNLVNIPLRNNSAAPATAISAVLSTTTAGVTITQPNSAYSDIPASAGPVNNTTPFQISTDNTVACFSNVNLTLTVTYSGGGGGSPATFNYVLPVGQQGLNYNVTSTTGSIPAGGSLVPLSQDDDFVVSIPMPSGFTSTIYGTPVTSLSASTNGVLTANATSSSILTNTALPAAFGTTPTLLAYWDDLDMDVADVTGGGIYTNTIGSAPNRQFYVEWRAQHFDETVNGPISTNFAIMLTEGSDAVSYIYASTGNGARLNGASATVGVQAASSGTQFTQFSFNTASLSAGLQLNFARPPGVCAQGAGTCAAPSGTISGTVTYGNAIPAATRFVSNVQINGVGSPNVSTVTGGLGATEGQYVLSGFGAGAYTVTPTKTGAVNGAISSLDAARVAQHVAATVILNATQQSVGDVSNNGSLSSLDAAMIAKFVAGPPFTAPGIGLTSNWRFTPLNRAYASVSSNVTGQDFSSVLMGEVTGNWANNGTRPANGPERTTSVEAPRVTVPAGGQINLPLTVTGAAGKEIIAYEFDLRYDPNVIQPMADPVDLTATVSRGLSAVANSAEPGLLRVVVYGPIPLDGNGVLLNLRFTAVGEPGTTSALTWESLIFNEGDPGTLVTDGRVDITPALSQTVKQSK